MCESGVGSIFVNLLWVLWFRVCNYAILYSVSGQSAGLAHFSGWWMHSPTLIFGSVDASTNSSFWVSRCIHRLEKYFLGWWMHPPTLSIESVDASTNPKRESVDVSADSIFESVDASTDPKIRVGGCIRRPKNYSHCIQIYNSRWMTPPTQKRAHPADCPLTV